MASSSRLAQVNTVTSGIAKGMTIQFEQTGVGNVQNILVSTFLIIYLKLTENQKLYWNSIVIPLEDISGQYTIKVDGKKYRKTGNVLLSYKFVQI